MSDLEKQTFMGRIPPGLIESINAGDCIVFLGAGAVQKAGLPGWIKLLNNLIVNFEKELPIDDPRREEIVPYLRTLLDKNKKKPTSDDLDQCAQGLEDQLGSAVMDAKIAEQLGEPIMGDEMNEIKDCIMGTPFCGIVTTNYDNVFPGVPAVCPTAKPLMRRMLRYSPNIWQNLAHAASSGQAPIPPTLQLHGSVNHIGTGLVLSRQGYRRLLNGCDYYQRFVSSLMAAKTILYVGFSFTDHYINDIRRDVVSMLGEFRPSDPPVAYTIQSTAEEQVLPCDGEVSQLHGPKKKCDGEIIPVAWPEEMCDFYRRHEGVHVITYPKKDRSEFSKLLHAIHDQTSPAFLLASKLSGKKILWAGAGDSQVKVLNNFFREQMEKYDLPAMTFDFAHGTSASEIISSALEQIQAVKYDLLISAFSVDGADMVETLMRRKTELQSPPTHDNTTSLSRTSTAAFVASAKQLSCPVLVFDETSPQPDAVTCTNRRKRATDLGAINYTLMCPFSQCSICTLLEDVANAFEWHNEASCNDRNPHIEHETHLPCNKHTC